MNYFYLPVESMAGAIQLVCYFFTMLAVTITYMMARH